jgi:hypothetical protein
LWPSAARLNRLRKKSKSLTPAAEAANENEALIAALEALRHPKSDFFRKL